MGSGLKKLVRRVSVNVADMVNNTTPPLLSQFSVRLCISNHMEQMIDNSWYPLADWPIGDFFPSEIC